ncbi:MAG: hypothetical protein JWM56_1066, partial [Candidatus Peribacteria bacterium]|nr:hypothetical protein [Candidatus Peribacteria bacterium]
MRGFSFLSRQRKGFLLLEVLIGIALLSAFIGGVSWVMLNGQQSTDSAIDRQRAAYLAEAGLEVARTIRDKDFSLLTVGGPYGYQLTSGTWELAGTETIQDGYSTRLVIEPISIGKRVKVTATTTWKFGNKRGGTVALSTELSNWRVQRQFGDWTIPGVDGSWAPGGPVGFTPTSNHWPIVASFLSLFRASHADAQVAAPAFRDVIAVGKYAYATTATTPGIYIFDISTTSAPVRISTAVSLPFGLIGDKMKLASDGTIYMIAKDPSTMQSVILQFNAVASPVFTTAYDFDGFAVNALSLDSHIDTAGRQMLYVGTK